MANIIEKAFDASKNIVRTIFLGNPNLFTTSDLNRQIEAFKYQIDSIEDRLGGISDIDSASAGSRDGSNIVLFIPRGSYFQVKTHRFPITLPTDNCFVLPNTTTAYLVAVGNYAIKTYDDDTTHDIAGAKFTDGTSLPAANQQVLINAKVEFVKSLEGLSYDFVYPIIECTRNGYKVETKTNFVKPGSKMAQVFASDTQVIKDLSTEEEISVGNHYDGAFAWIKKQINSLKRIPSKSTSWHNLYWGSVDDDSKWKICNGCLVLYFRGSESVFRNINIAENAGNIYNFGWQLPDFPEDAFKGLYNIKTTDGGYVKYLELEEVKGSSNEGVILSTDIKWIVGSFYNSEGTYTGTFMGISCRKEHGGHCVTHLVKSTGELITYSDSGSVSVSFPSGSKILPLPFEE